MRNLIQAIIFIAFFLQAMIPLGFMPNAEASERGTALVICSGLEIKTIYVDENGEPISHEDSSSASAPCLYSALTGFSPTDFFHFPAQDIVLTGFPLPEWKAQLSGIVKFQLPQAIGPPVLI